MGSGKSLFAEWLRDFGCPVLDADDVVRELEEPGGAACAPIRREFGDGVMTPAGGVDRRRLAEIVFSDPLARKKLNALVHPRVRKIMETWLRAREREGAGVAAVVVPLLFEAGWDKGWDEIVCVSCAEPLRIERLLNRGFRMEEVRARMAAQMSPTEKARRSDRVIDNSGDRQALRQAARELVKRVMEKKYE